MLPIMKGVEQIEQTFHNLTSPKRGHTFWGFVAVLVVASIFIWAKHGTWLRSPNAYMLGDSLDGYKNYMTAAWHVQHDSSYVHYSGMGYPFGEHVLFTNNQPIISAGIKWWSRHVFDVNNEVIGILNWLQVLSMIFGAGVIYLMLRKLHIRVWYAGLSALGIAFLSPQYNFFEAQFGLSHIWVFPMLLLLLCRYEERFSRRYQSLLIGILLWFAAQLHFYYLGVSAVFLGFYTLFQIFLNLSWRSIWTRLSHLTVMVLLPYAFLNVWLHWSDYCPDRTATPAGFMEYTARWEGVFFPYDYFPLRHWIDQLFTHIHGMEGKVPAYAGLVAFLFTLWLVLKRRFRLFEPEWEAMAYHRVHKNYLRGICFAAFATLLLSLGIPFTIKGLEWTADYMGPFRQFRDLGRFAWAFYYVINVLVFYILWNKSQRMELNEKWIAFVKTKSSVAAHYLPDVAKWSLAILPLIILCSEAIYFQNHHITKTVPNLALRSVVANSNDHWLNKVDFARFQALMPLPYYHIGSENIWLEPYPPLFKKMQYTALQTGIPDMGVNMSRTAISRMVKSLQFSLLACEPPAMLSEFPDNRPIALMIEPSMWEETKIGYEHLLSKASTVYDGPDLRIMSLIPDSVRTWSQQQARKISAEMDRFARFDAKAGFRSEKQALWYAYLNFDTVTTSQHVFQGKGAGEANLGDTTWIWKKNIPKGSYTFSIWIKVDEDMGMTQELSLLETNNSPDNHFYRRQGTALQKGIQTIVNGWALFEYPFEVEKDGSDMEIYLYKPHVNQTFWYDEVLIKNKDFNLYRREPGWVQRNNFWYKLPKI